MAKTSPATLAMFPSHSLFTVPKSVVEVWCPAAASPTMGNAFAMMNSTAAPIEYARVRSSPSTFRRYSTAPQRGQRAFPPGGSGISRWSRSQSWQACRWGPCITRTIARVGREG